MKQFLACAIAAGISISSASATIVDLNAHGLGHGEILTTQIAGLTVSAVADGGGTANDFAIIFNTETPGSGSGADADLGAPFDDPTTGALEVFRPGNVLAVAEGDCSAGFCRPDDNGSGGVIDFVFDRDVVFNSLDVFDFRTDELTITLRDAADAVVLMIVGPSANTDTGDGTFPNLFTTLELGGVVFRSATFDFGGSGAIGNFNIQEVPIPAALPLLLSGIAGLGFVGRRRKRA